jgi:sporulation integral membrane protein YtvI
MNAFWSRVLLYTKIIVNFILFIIGALLCIFLLPKLLHFFLPFVIGWIIAMIANPLVRFLEKRVKMHRKHSSAIILILVIAAIIGVLALLITLLIREIRGLMEDLPNIIAFIKEQLNDFNVSLKQMTRGLPPSIQKLIDNAITTIGGYASNLSENIELPTISSAGNFAKNVAEGFLGFLVVILSAYFFAAGRDEMAMKYRKYIPKSAVNYWSLITDNFKAAFGGYFKAQFKIMFVMIIILFVGFEILQVDYSFLIAVGIAFLDVLPVFGTGAVLCPWAIIDVISGNYVRAIVLVAIYLVCQVVKQLLQPKMVGDSIGLNPLATLLFLFIGYRLYGVLGMIIGIPVGMVLVKLYNIGLFDRIIKGFQIIAHDLNEFRKF